MAYIVLTGRCVIAIVFFASFATKVNRRGYLEFVASVRALRLLPVKWIRPAAVGVVVAEGGSAVAVALPWTGSFGFVPATALLVVFTTGILVAMRHGPLPPCRCFGASRTPLGRPHVIRNLVLIALCGTGIVGAAMPAGDYQSLGVGVAILAAGALALMVVRLDDILALFGKPAS